MGTTYSIKSRITHLEDKTILLYSNCFRCNINLPYIFSQGIQLSPVQAVQVLTIHSSKKLHIPVVEVSILYHQNYYYSDPLKILDDAHQNLAIFLKSIYTMLSYKLISTRNLNNQKNYICHHLILFINFFDCSKF